MVPRRAVPTSARIARVSTMLLAATAVGALAACSSSGGSSTSPSGSTGPTETSSASSSATGGPSAEIAAAQAAVAKVSAPPTALNVTTPLKSKPSVRGALVYLQCESAACNIINTAIKDATKAAGIPYVVTPFKLADPSTLVAGMQQALQMKPAPAGVVFSGIPQAVWGAELPAFVKAKVPLIPIAAGAVTASPAMPAGALDGPADVEAQARAVANYFIADSQAKGGALIVNVPDVGALADVTKTFQSTVKAGCTGCTTKTVDLTLAQVGSGGVVPAIVSALQRETNLKYVVSVEGDFVGGLHAALAAAGLTDIKVVGVNVSESEQQDLKTGQGSAFANTPFKIMGWTAVDIALRSAEGMTVTPGDGGLPLQLLTKDNVGTPAPSVDVPTDYQDQFKKLWLVG